MRLRDTHEAPDSGMSIFRDYFTLFSVQDAQAFESVKNASVASDMFVRARTASGHLRVTPAAYAAMIKTWRPDLAAPLRVPKGCSAQRPKQLARTAARNRSLDAALVAALGASDGDTTFAAYVYHRDGSPRPQLRLVDDGVGTPDVLVRAIVGENGGEPGDFHAVTSRHAFDAAANKCALRLSFACGADNMVVCVADSIHAGKCGVLDATCACPVCDGRQFGYALGYLHHLADTAEMSLHTLLAMYAMCPSIIVS